MKRSAATSGLLWLLLLWIPSATAVWGQAQVPPKKYLLKESPASVGDVSVVERTQGFKMDVFGKPRGVEGAVPQSLPVSQRGRERYTETVLAVDKEGPTHVKRAYTLARRSDSPKPGVDPVVVVGGRQGKTVTLLRKAGKVTVKITGAKLTARELKTLQGQFSGDEEVRSFPDYEVAVGEEWTLDNAGAAKRQGVKSIVLKGRFLEVVPFQGRECAHLAIELNMESAQNGFPMTWAMKGDLYHAMDVQKILMVKVSGPVEMKGTVQNRNQTIDLEGIGNGDLVFTQRWTKLAGKPLPAPKAVVPAQ